MQVNHLLIFDSDLNLNNWWEKANLIIFGKLFIIVYITLTKNLILYKVFKLTKTIIEKAYEHIVEKNSL